MRMPLLNKIINTSYSCPSEWTLICSKEKHYYVKFDHGVLSVFRDDRFNGKEILRKTFPLHKGYRYMATENMLAHAGFRLNHDEPDDDEPTEIICG